MIVETVTANDVSELIQLYRAVYGEHYPLPLGTDPEVMARFVTDPDVSWLVARRASDRRIVGSALLKVDPARRVGKVEGVVVHPEHRAGKVAQRLVILLSDMALAGRVDSVYATARTASPAPQLMFLRNGYLPLGIFPHARKVRRHETLVLLARFADGVLTRRHPVGPVPERLLPLLSAAETATGLSLRPNEIRPLQAPTTAPSVVHEWEFLPVGEPADSTARYPFHPVNLRARTTDGSVTVHVNLGEDDGYCALLDVTPELCALADWDDLVHALAERGVRYLEMLLPLDGNSVVDASIAHGFRPTAIYPALRQEDGLFRDHVVLSRALQPLDFRHLIVAPPFEPFLAQYLLLGEALDE